MSRQRCKRGAHRDERERGGKHFTCVICGDTFPCRGSCPHLDCIVATGRELPDSVGVEARGALVDELRALYPDNTFATDVDDFGGI